MKLGKVFSLIILIVVLITAVWYFFIGQHLFVKTDFRRVPTDNSHPIESA